MSIPIDEAPAGSAMDAAVAGFLDMLMRPHRNPSPVRIIQRELTARGWSQRDLAIRAGCTVEEIAGIIEDGKPLTLKVAEGLAQAFGTSASLWEGLGK